MGFDAETVFMKIQLPVRNFVEWYLSVHLL
jgi:hypothetical protein